MSKLGCFAVFLINLAAFAVQPRPNPGKKQTKKNKKTEGKMSSSVTLVFSLMPGVEAPLKPRRS